MPLLKAQGFVEDDWTILADDEAPPASGDIVVPFARSEARLGCAGRS